MTDRRRITEAPGIGKKASDDLSSLGVTTLRDMISLRPRAYDDRREERRIREASIDDPSISCRITVLSHAEFSSKAGRTLKVLAMDDDGTRIEILCFNRYFLKQQLMTGTSWYIYGKAMKNRGVYQISSFEIKRTREEAGIGRILPVYPLTGSLTEKTMRRAAEYSLLALSPIPDELPLSMYEKEGLMHHDEAYKRLHFPHSMEDARKALDTLAFTELFLMELSVLREKPNTERKKSHPTKREEELLKKLPFSLTEDQLDKRVLREFEANHNRQFKNAVDSLFPSKLRPVIVELSGIPEEKKVHEITKEERHRFVRLIKDFTMTLTGLRGYNEAIITKGGVSVREIDPGTMESRLVNGLYFAGEVLDLDAVTGGYNLQIAWSTGYLAGVNAGAESILKGAK